MSINLSSTEYNFEPRQWLVGGLMLFVAFGALVLVPTVLATLLGKGLIRVIPILTGVITGYVAALL